jgi:hypothetical protein
MANRIANRTAELSKEQAMAAGARAGNRPALAERVVPLLAVVALVFGLVAGPAGVALGDEDSPDDGDPAEVTREAWWTNSPGQALPGAVYNEFPPEVVCLVFPEMCASEMEDLTSPIDEAKPERDAYPNPPAQPVNPNTLPASRMGGVERYVSALHFELPPTPDGMEIARMTLLLTEAQPTYAVNSPAFRQIVLATMASVQAGQPLVEEFLKVMTESDEYPPVDRSVLEVEACPATEPFEEGDNQDWETRPAVDCILGATGARGDDGVWSFDLTFAAKAWDEGMVDNEGVYFGPLSAENLAYGDPDMSDSAQVSFAGAESDTPPLIVIEYQDEPAPLPDFDDGPMDSGSFQSGFSGEDEFSSAPPTADAFSPPADGPSDFEPVAADREAGGASDAGEPAVAAAQALSPVGDAEVPSYVWLLLPAALAGMYVMSRALTAQPALAQDRPGAMSRLIEQRVNGGAATGPQRA